MAHIANKVDAKDKKLFEVFTGQRYKIDVFQREYRWQRVHVESLISDLTTGFLKSYNIGDSAEKCSQYDCYYMGPIVLCQDEKGDLSIVDGQQRLTSFTLLLIYILHLQKQLGLDDESSADIMSLLYVKRGGKKTFVLNIESRNSIIEKLIDSPSKILSESSSLDMSESNQNILHRYEDICSLYPIELKNKESLPVFTEWLLHNIVLVEVRAYSIENAYTIFETMNNRGLTLNPTEILKGYLLSKIVDNHPENEEKAEEANTFWTDRILKLKTETGYEESELDFFRAWLRAKYAETQRAKKVGSENEDFELIGTQFHSWVKNNSKNIGLAKPSDFYFFIRSDFDFFSSTYLKIYHYMHSYEFKHMKLFLNAHYSIADSLTFPLLLSPITKIDFYDELNDKINTVSAFIDCYTNIRMLQNRSITQSSIRNNIYEIVRKIRNSNISQLYSILSDEYNKITSYSEVFPSFQQMNNYGYYHYLNARILFHMDSQQDFRSLLRSRKHDSYILTQIFSIDDIGKEFDEATVYAYFNSVANYTLLRRTSLSQYLECSSIKEKIDFLNEHHKIFHFESESCSAIKYITKHEELLRDCVKEIWSFSREQY